MSALTQRPIGLIVILAFFFVFIGFWVFGLGGAVVAYDQVAALGLHPERDNVDPVTALVTQAISLADVLIQLPFFILGVVGLWQRRFWGLVAAWIALGINLYWTTVAWFKQAYYLQASVATEPFGISLHSQLALVYLFSAWVIWYLMQTRAAFD